MSKEWESVVRQSCASESVLVVVVDDQHGDGRRAEHALGDAPEQRPADAGATVTADHDEVDVVVPA